jgi:hypothetical protein
LLGLGEDLKLDASDLNGAAIQELEVDLDALLNERLAEAFRQSFSVTPVADLLSQRL